MSDQDMFDYLAILHDRWLANPTAENWATFAAARDAWLQGGGKSS